ncbi:MAG: hypothetical protein HYX79_09380 [Chloroflexi bacterium]|nr:hypothetical protein [Chloroflexota bacterium]
MVDKESDLYPYVETWLKENRLCFKTAKNKGLKKYSIIDVIGITDVGGDLSGEVETIAVEVKRGTEPFAKASGQALANKVYANRIYLADLRDDQFNPDEIYIAGHLGIGLIQIQNRECKEVLSSPYYKPIEKLNLALLENLALGKCQLCGYFFAIGDKRKIWSNLASNLEKAIKDKKGFMFENRAVDIRKRKVGNLSMRRRKDGVPSERKFICIDCISFHSKLKINK